MSRLVLTRRNPPVATLELNRSDRHNSLVPELLRELCEAVDEVEGDDEVRAVVLAAAGKSFSTGGDVRGFYEAGEGIDEYAAATVGLLNDAILGLMRLSKPVVAAVHGIVTGGSIGLLLGSDIVLMSPEAAITPWYSAVGYSPDGGWTAILPGIIGKARTSKILLNNETITAQEAMAWGLVSEIVDSTEIRGRAMEVAKGMSRLKPGSLTVTKRLLHSNLECVAAGLDAERAAFVEQIVTAEARHGMQSFLGDAT